jgi:pyrroline-5-carboxylate reductase
MIRQKIGIIGVGNMGSAILEGLFEKKIARPNQVWVYDKIEDKVLGLVKRWKVHRTAACSELVQQVEVILLAVKPQDLAEAAGEWKAFLRPGHLLISILAGTPIAKIKKILGTNTQIIRAMPNLGAKVGEAVTALTGGRSSSLVLAKKIFSGCGKTVRLHERYFDLVTAVSGSGPAYFFLMMELLMAAAMKYGLPEKVAECLAVQTALGAAKLAQTEALPPEALRRMVTSKGGTTEAALKVLEREKFRDIFLKAIEAALKRGRELSR